MNCPSWFNTDGGACVLKDDDVAAMASMLGGLLYFLAIIGLLVWLREALP